METIYILWNKTLIPYFIIGWLVSVPICAFILGFIMGRWKGHISSWVYWFPVLNVLIVAITSCHILLDEIIRRIPGWSNVQKWEERVLNWTLFLPSTLWNIGVQKGWGYREKLRRKEFVKQLKSGAVIRRSEKGKYNDS